MNHWQTYGRIYSQHSVHLIVSTNSQNPPGKQADTQVPDYSRGKAWLKPGQMSLRGWFNVHSGKDKTASLNPDHWEEKTEAVRGQDGVSKLNNETHSGKQRGEEGERNSE